MAHVTRTARDVVTDAMMAAEILGSAETPSAEDAAYVLRRLIDLLASWAAQPLLQYQPSLWGTEETDENATTPWAEYDDIITPVGRDRVNVTLLIPSTLDSTITLPSEYFRALTAALAIEICPAFGHPPSEVLLTTAQQAVRVVKVHNKVTPSPSLLRELPYPDSPFDVLRGR